MKQIQIYYLVSQEMKLISKESLSVINNSKSKIIMTEILSEKRYPEHFAILKNHIGNKRI